MTHTGRILAPEVRAILGAPDDDRIRFAQRDTWIGYPRALEVLAEMERLIHYEDKARPQNMLLLAETNNGKTTIVNKLKELHPDVDDPTVDRVRMPVVKLDAPPKANEDRFYNHALDKLGAVFKIRAPVDAKLFQLRRLLRDLGMRVLVLDEINNSLTGTLGQRAEMFNAIKTLSNHLQRPIILTGIFESESALREDRQIQNRFPAIALPRWQLDRDFLQLLASFESLLPLRRSSSLASQRLAPLLLAMSDQIIGELHHVLIRASEQAIRSGKEQITPKLLLDLPWLPPSARDKGTGAAQHGETFKINYRDRLHELGQGHLTQDDSDDEN